MSHKAAAAIGNACEGSQAAEAADPVRERWVDANPNTDPSAHYTEVQGVVACGRRPTPKFKPPKKPGGE